jgi:hypothetical protein
MERRRNAKTERLKLKLSAAAEQRINRSTHRPRLPLRRPVHLHGDGAWGLEHAAGFALVAFPPNLDVTRIR